MAKSTKRADGRLVKSIVDPRTGKRKFFYGYNEREISRKIMEYTSESDHGRLFSDVASEWWDKTEDTLAIQSIRTYTPALRRAVEMFGNMPVKNITPRNIKALINSLVKDGLSMKTISTQRMVVNQIMNHAVMEGDIDVNPCSAVQLPKELPRTKRTSASKSDEDIIRSRTDGWLFPFFAIMTGMRKGEILALQWRDIDMENDLIYVTKSVAHNNNHPILKSPKTEAGRRIVPLLPQLKERLESIQDRKPDNYIFSIDGVSLMTNMQFTKLLKDYHTETGTTFTAHQLRHSFATNAFELGVSGKSVQEIIGHKQLSTTMDMYTDFRMDSLREAAKILSKNDKK